MNESHPEFDSLLFKIMAGPSKKQKHLSYMGLNVLLYNREASDFMESEFSDDSDMNVEMASGSEQRANCDDEGSSNGNSDVRQDTWTLVGAEKQLVPFDGKPGVNVDLEYRSNPLEYFELFISPEITELISR
jgi:hypothetical protein